jgi:hypothetical protein
MHGRETIVDERSFKNFIELASMTRGARWML